MAERIGDAEVHIGLSDEEYKRGLAEDERLFDAFSNKVSRKKTTAKIDADAKGFWKEASKINAAVKAMDKESATVTIKAETRGLFASFVKVRAALAAIGGSFAAFVSSRFNSFQQKLNDKKPFENFARGIKGMRLQMGFFSTTVGQAASTLTAFGPVIEGLVGAMTSFIGTIGSGLAGAAAIGGAGLAGMVATLGLVKAAVAPTVKGVDAAAKAAKAYETQVQKTGVESEKAKNKLAELNSTMAHVPQSSRDAIRTWAKVTTSFREMTRASAERGVGQVLNAGAQTARKLMPAAARQTNQAIGTIGGAAESAGKAIRGDEISGQIDTVMSGFNRALPSLLKGFGQLGELMLRIFAAASPAMVGVVKSFAEWATQLNNANRDSGVLGQTIDRQVERFRHLVSLLSAVGGLFKTIFSAGAADGDSMVVTLTNLVNRWNTFLKSTEGQTKLREFFTNARNVATQFGSALVTGVGIIGRYIEATRPLAAAVLAFVTWLGKAVTFLQQLPFGVGAFVQLAAGAGILLGKLGLLGPVLQGLRVALTVIFTLMRTSPIGIIVTALAALVVGLKLAYDNIGWFHTAVDRTFAFLKGVAGTVMPVVVGAVKGGISAIVSFVQGRLPLIRAIFSGVWNGAKAVVQAVWPVIKGVVSGGLQVIKGVIQVFGGIFKGDFRQIWEGIKNIFSGAVRALGSILRGAVSGITSAAKAIGEGIFGAIKKGVEGVVGVVTDVVNSVIRVLNKIPGVEIGLVGGGGGGGTTAGTNVQRAPRTEHLARGGRTGSMQAAQEGGIVTSPIVMMGEEAPKHPEWVIPENPAYRDRAISLWAAAGKSIGAFAKGGRVQSFGLGGFFGGIKDKVLGGAKSVISKVILSGLEAVSGAALPKGMAGLMPWLIERALRFAKKKSGGGKMMQAAKEISGKYPYVYGGGHGGFAPSGGGFDCSGAVSYVLGKAGYISSPMSTDGLKTWADSGDGDLMTVGVRGSTGRQAHTMMRIGKTGGKSFFESGSGHGPLLVSGWSGNFPIHRHSDATPKGMATGGKWAPKPGRGAKGNWGYDAKSVPRATQRKIEEMGIEAFMPDSNKFIGWGLRTGGRIPPREEAARIIAEAARAAGIDPAILWGLYGAESNFGQNPGTSPAGAQGPFQFMPATARAYGIDPHNFRQAARAAAKYLAKYKSRGTAGMLAAYNAGPAGNPNNPETKAYIPKVQRLARTFPGGAQTGPERNADGTFRDPEAGGPDAEQERQRKKWEAEIKRNLNLIDKLRKESRHLPGGKKGARRRTAIQDKIANIQSKNRLLRDKIREIKETPTEGEASTAETALTESETVLQDALQTPELKDDVSALNDLLKKTVDYRKEKSDRLKVVNQILGGKLTKKDRQKYLAEKQQLTAAIKKIDRRAEEAKATKVETVVGMKFGGGRGQAGLDEATQEASITATLNDDLKALDDQIRYQEALAAAYEPTIIPARGGRKRRVVGGDPEKRAKALKKAAQLREDKAKLQFQVAMQPADLALAIAGSTEDLADDVAAMNYQLQVWQAELRRRVTTGDIAGVIEAQNAINGLTSNIKSANKEMQDKWIRGGSIDYLQALRGLFESTDSLADDLSILPQLQSDLYDAANRAFSVGDYITGYQLQAEGNQVGKRIKEIREAQQDLPLQARKAEAALTESTADDRAVLGDMLSIAQGRLDTARALGDYEGIIKYAGEVKSIKDELKQSEQQRLESIRILSEARQNLYRQFGGNQISGGFAPTGTVVNVVNNYKTVPLDPHSWSRDVAFELRAAI